MIRQNVMPMIGPVYVSAQCNQIFMWNSEQKHMLTKSINTHERSDFTMKDAIIAMEIVLW